MTQTSVIKRLQIATAAMQSIVTAQRGVDTAFQNLVSSMQEYAQVARPVYEEYYQRLILKNAADRVLPKNRL